MTLPEALAAVVAAAGPFPRAPLPRLSPADLREMRKMHAAKAGFAAICGKFGVTEADARAVCARGQRRSR